MAWTLPLTALGAALGAWAYGTYEPNSPLFGRVIGREELERTHALIVETTGRAPRAFRAPHGYRNPFIASATRRLGYTVFGWTFGVWDSDPRVAAEEIRRRAPTRPRPGAIVLLHDGDGYDPQGDRSRTAAALPGIIADARAAGYRFGSLAELVARCRAAGAGWGGSWPWWVSASRSSSSRRFPGASRSPRCSAPTRGCSRSHSRPTFRRSSPKDGGGTWC